MKWAIWFALACSGGIAAALLIIWLAGGFARVGLDTNVTLALVLGIFFSSLLGIALMGLIFHSNRSGRDEDAYRTTIREDSDRH
jgi:hypothetical protein